MKGKFWKFSITGIVLVVILVLAAGVLVVKTWQMKSPFQDEIIMLQDELQVVRKANTTLKAEVKSLEVEVAFWMRKSLDIKHFFSDIQSDVDTLLGLSRCINCCHVTKLIIDMESRFDYFKAQISRFLSE